MTLHTDSDSRSFTPRTNGAASSPSPRSLGAVVGELSQILTQRFNEARTSAKPFTDGAGQRIGAAGRRTLDEVRKRPIATTLAVAGAGLGLMMLFSGRARAGAAGAGAEALKAYKRHRR